MDSVFDADPVDDFLTFTAAATLRTLRPYLGHPRWEEVHPVLRHFVNLAQETTAEQILQIFDHFHLMNLRLVELFRTSRILVTPTCAGVAPFADEMESTVNGERTANWIQFTYPFNMTKSPAATVRAGTSSEGLPIGIQLDRAPARRPGRAPHRRGPRGRPGPRYARNVAGLSGRRTETKSEEPKEPNHVDRQPRQP